MDIDIPLKKLYKELVKIRNNGGSIISQPLGFYRIFITAKDALSPGVMLHAWLEKDQHKQSLGHDIHSHTFDLTSRILVGELINELYKIEPNSNGKYRIVNVFHDGIKSNRIITEELVNATLISKETVSEGNKYSFGSKIFHKTCINKFPTLTLMKKTNMISENAVNIIDVNHTNNEVGIYKMPALNQNIVWEKILNCLEKAF